MEVNTRNLVVGSVFKFKTQNTTYIVLSMDKLGFTYKKSNKSEVFRTGYFEFDIKNKLIPRMVFLCQ